MKKIGIYINEEYVHSVSFDDSNEEAKRVFDIHASNPKIYLIDYFKNLPKIGERYSGENATTDFVIGENYGITVFFVYCVNEIVKFILPMQYTLENEIMVAALASDPVLKVEE